METNREDTRAVIPEQRLARAALDLFIKDGIDYLTTCESQPKGNAKGLFYDQKRAFNDLCRCGRMTKRLAEFNDLDARYISSKFRRYVQRYYSEVHPEADTSL